MQIQRVEVPGLAHYSYVVSASGKAVVIDPKRDVDTYLDDAAVRGLQITHILETHIHADYASGALALAKATGAEMWLSAHDKGEDFVYAFPHHEFRDREELRVEEMRFVALHTPGHTPEHLSFVLYDSKRDAAVPIALFSGDFLFVGSVGRPDLLGEAAKQRLARELFRSQQERIAHLPDGVEVYPAHGAGSMCGSGMSDRPQTTLGYERKTNAFLNQSNESDFITRVLSTVPPFPDYYRRMKRVNSAGPTLLAGFPGQKCFTAAEVRAAAEGGAAVVLDLRRPEAFGGAHVPGSINIGAGNSLSMWAAWVVPYERPIYMVGDESCSYEEAARSLIRVGLDEVQGYLKGGIFGWIEAGFEQAHIPQISVEELHAKRDAFVLDVRGDGEWRSGHIENAHHIMAGDIERNSGTLPKEREINVICGSGYRSSITTSLLQRQNFKKLANVSGGMTAWNRRKLPTVQGTEA